jgi:hypothetical protein
LVATIENKNAIRSLGALVSIVATNRVAAEGGRQIDAGHHGTFESSMPPW